MNSLIILPAECVDPTRGILSNERALYAYDTHGIREGQSIKVAVLGGRKGIGFVSAASKDHVEVFISGETTPSSLYPIDLIVGVSRPQTVKKVIQAATILGARSLHFVKSEHGEKSYLQSQALEVDHVQFEVIKGLEQVWESIPPQIHVHRNFTYFLENHVPTLDTNQSDTTCIKLVAHPGGRELRAILMEGETVEGGTLGRASPSVVIAIGPERGWSDGEVHNFRSTGFTQVGLGPRVMRVELATVFIFGQLHACLGMGLSS
jgi:RsmE family RNA methyltransferase